MTTPSLLPPDLDTNLDTVDRRPTAEPSSRRRRVHRLVALAAAGGLLASVLGVSAVATSAPASDSLAGRQSDFGSTENSGSDPWSRAGDSYDSGRSQAATVDSDPATASEGKGVVLIDTVLSSGAGAGTGIVLTADGEVLTNYHVVEDSTSVKVTIATTGATYDATVVGASEPADVALLQLKDASGLAVSTIDDDTVQLGDRVTAVGNAGGTGTLTAADGTVTSLSTPLTTSSEGGVEGESLTGLIQTDADVVSGDSGGPLVDSEGEVVGVDTAASTGSEIDGYAIPIGTALAVVDQIRSGNETTSVRIGPGAFLGVQLLATIPSSRGYPGRTGASSAPVSGATLVGVVDGGAADSAGLMAGDTITKLGSTAISDTDALSSALSTHEPGDRVEITWTTAAGQSESSTVTLGTNPAN